MMPLADAARELGVAPVTLKRWRKLGCPCVPGRRGRGHAALYDPAAIKAWRAAHGREALALELGTVLPGVLADGALEAWRTMVAPNKRELAVTVLRGWYYSTDAALEVLRTENHAVPKLRMDALPEAIDYLRKIADG